MALRTLTLVLVLLACTAPASQGSSVPQTIAHWSFDQPQADRWPDQSGRGHDAAAGNSASVLEPSPGLLKGAVRFKGNHRLAVPTHQDFAGLDQIAFSVWVRPDGFDPYNEIFRKEDGDRRLLFSFQENGSILSLGLNVGGYVECDARIDPAMLLDGLWHHCAAAFDGKTMRVYLDGREVGSLDRAGSITSGGNAVACIGSANGGECFRGAMDDLQIYSVALNADDITRLYAPGREAQLEHIRQQEKALARLYVTKATFAESLAEARRRVQEEKVAIDSVLAAAMARRISTDFPDELAKFTSYTRLTPAAYVQGEQDRVNRLPLERLVALMTEYRPLTEHQVSRMTDQQRQQWEEVASIEAAAKKLLAVDQEAAFSPQWIDLILAAGSRVDFRPYEREAVAPYVPPATPPTRTRSACRRRGSAPPRLAPPGRQPSQRGPNPPRDRLDSRPGGTHRRRTFGESRLPQSTAETGPVAAASRIAPRRGCGTLLRGANRQTIDRARQPRTQLQPPPHGRHALPAGQ